MPAGQPKDQPVPPVTYGCLSAFATAVLVSATAFGWLLLTTHSGNFGLKNVGDGLFAAIIGTYGAALSAIVAFFVGWLIGKSRLRDWQVKQVAEEED